VYSTRLHVYTRASLTDILARKIARVGQVGGLVGEDRRACQAIQQLTASYSCGKIADPVTRDPVPSLVGIGVGVRVGRV